MRIVAVPQLQDNYAYLVIDPSTHQAGVVDCAEADAVWQAAQEESCELVAILPTHHHYDHVGGNLDLLKYKPLEVYGYAGQADRIPGCTREVKEGDVFRVGRLAARVLFIPAHTTGHVAYYFEDEKAVFTGDTLFAGGCGRLFEGDAAMMIGSLSKLITLPDDTRVYFGHEYTKKNLEFALTLEPGNRDLQEKYRWVVAERQAGRPTVPTTIGSEKQTNPFLRWRSPELRATLKRHTPDLVLDDVHVFARTRALKDAY